MKMNDKTKKAGKILGTIAVVVVIVFSAYGLVLKEPTAARSNPQRHLFVDATYLLKIEETDESVKVICTPYLTNNWGEDSGVITIIAYVIDTANNLALSKSTVDIGTISADSTSEIEIPIELTNKSYKVDLLIFEDNKMVIKGNLMIRSRFGYNGSLEHLDEKTWEVSLDSAYYSNVH